MTPKYLAPYNKLYQRVVDGSVRNIQEAMKREVDVEDECSPLRMISSSNVFPLHVLFETYNDVLSRSILKELYKNNSLLDASKKLDWKHRGVLINKNCAYASETLKTQEESLLKTLFTHAFLIKGGHVLCETGSANKTTCFYVNVQGGQKFIFDEEEREIDGYYMFAGAPFSIVLVAKPLTREEMKEQGALNPGLNISSIFDERNIDQFPIKSHKHNIEKWISDGFCEDKTVSLVERFDAGVPIKEMKKELSSSL